MKGHHFLISPNPHKDTEKLYSKIQNPQTIFTIKLSVNDPHELQHM